MKNYLCMFTDTVKKKKKKKYTTRKIQLNLWMLIPNETHKIRTISRDYPYTLACCLIDGPIKFSRYVVINTNETLATLHIRFFLWSLISCTIFLQSCQSEKVIVVFPQGPNTPVQKLLPGETSRVCKNGWKVIKQRKFFIVCAWVSDIIE